VTALVCVATGWGSVPLHVVVLMAAVVAAAELVALPTRPGPSRWPASLAEGAVGACLLLGDGAWSVVAAGAGIVAAHAVRRCPRSERTTSPSACSRPPPRRPSAGWSAAGWSAPSPGSRSSGWWAACSSPPPSPRCRSGRWCRSPLDRADLGAAAAASAGVGLLATGLVLHAPVGLLGLAAGAAAVRSATCHAAWRRGEARLFAHLAQAPERTADASAQLLVTAAARLLRGADVELVVLDGVLPRRYAGDERGQPGRPSDVVALDEPWVLTALAAPGVGAAATTTTGRP
jgi:hypothetical protein